MNSQSASVLSRLPHSAIRLCGHLPDSWEIRELDSLVDHGSPICYGILMPGEDQPDGVLVVRVKDMSGGRIANNGLHRTSKLIDDQYSRSRLKAHDILLAIRGATAGMIATASEMLEGANITQDTARIRLGNGCCRDYIFQLLQGEFLQHQIQLNIVGQAVQGINIAEVRRLAIPLPPRLEQEKIATVLTTWDRTIELTENLIATKHKRQSALRQRLLTGVMRFKPFIRSSGRHKTPVGEMPLDWKIYKLGTIISKVKRKNAVGEEHVLTASGKHGLVDQREFFNRSVAGADLSGYYLLKRGEFAYNRSAMNGYPFGAIKRLDRYEQGVLSTLYICFGLVDDTCDSDFMAHYFEAGMLDRQLGEVTQVGGRAHGLLNITDADFYSMHVVLPDTQEQLMIALVLNEQQREIELLKKKLEALRRQKQGLMQQLLTGKVRVKVTESSGE